MPQSDFLIIGAGLAGLACAADLQKKGATVQIVDKGRGVGGRCATRRLGTTRLDHGAQFFTARTPRLQALCASGFEEGWLRIWNHGYPLWREESIISRPPGHPRYVPQNGMSELARQIGAEVQVYTETQITKIKKEKERAREESGVYSAEDANGNTYQANALILNLPPEQLLALASPLLPDTVQTALNAVTFNPCWAVFGLLETDIPVSWPALELENHPVLGFISRDHTRRPDGAPPALLLHATGDWTRAHFDMSPDAVQEIICAAAREIIGPFTLQETHTHRWKYAQPIHPYGKKCEWLSPEKIGFCGDWCEGARVEGAIESGWTLAALF